MSYPTSVPTLHRLKNTGGRPRRVPIWPETHPDVQVGQEGEFKAEDNELGDVELGYGDWGSTRLQKDLKGWRWDFISDHQAEVKLELGEGKMLFPPSRSLGLLAKEHEKPSMNQSLEHVRQICDKYEHLGLDELVSAELQSIATEHGASEPDKAAYDPFLGNRMVYLRNPHAGVMRNVVFFTSGEIDNYLHAAAVIGNQTKRIKNVLLRRFAVGHVPLERFPTGILQIVASPITSSHYGEQAQAICVRLHSSIHLYKVLPEHHWTSNNPSAPVRLTQMAVIRTANLGGRRIVDMKLDPGIWGRVVIVDESGGIWIWARRESEAGTKQTPGEVGMALSQIREPVHKEKNQFFRFAFGNQPGTIIVLSANEAVSIDIENPLYPVRPLLSIGPSRTFTAIEPTSALRQASTLCLVTTREVIWVDETAPGQVMMSWKHNISDGDQRDFEITFVPRPDGDCFILSSRSSPVLTIFHTTSGSSLRLLHPPYTISLTIDSRLKPLSDLIIVDRAMEKTHGRDALVILATGRDGSVWSAPLNPIIDGDRSAENLRPVLDDELRTRMEKAGMGDEGGPTLADGAETKFTVMDTRWAWLAINKDLTPTDDAPVFTADELERYLRELDAPFEHFMTAAELARDSVADESSVKRSQILRPLPLPNMNEHEVQRLSTVNLDRELHIVSSQGMERSAIDGHLTDNTRLTRLDHIRQTLLTAFPDRNRHAPTRNRHQRCIDALALDLALSSTVLSSETIPTSSDRSQDVISDDDVLARAAGLTINETGPPPVKLSILHPRATGSEEEVHHAAILEESDRSKRVDTPSTRSLLAEWTIGTNPSSYIWKPWITDDNEEATEPAPASSFRPIRPLPSPRPGSPIVRPNTFASQPSSRYVPPVVHFNPDILQGLRKTQSIPAILSAGGPRSSPPPNMVGSQGSMANPESQEAAATQVERGPFGGRGEKKKKVKKRMGGF